MATLFKLLHGTHVDTDPASSPTRPYDKVYHAGDIVSSNLNLVANNSATGSPRYSVTLTDPVNEGHGQVKRGGN
jgi:hypothetical protein